MKYTIEGFSQVAALKFKDIIGGKTIQIDITDLSILRWLVDFYPKMPKMEIDGNSYVWISYKALLNDMPLLDIKKVALANRLKKMAYFGILDFKLLTNGNTYTYYSFGKNYEKLISFNNSLTPVIQMTPPCHSNDTPLSVEQQPPCHSNDTHNNSSTIDSSINQSIKHNKLPATNVADSVSEIFDYWKQIMESPRSKLDDKRTKAIKRALVYHSVEEIKQAIDGCSFTDWNMGRSLASNGKKYNDIELICRDNDHIDSFIQMAETNKPMPQLQLMKIIYNEFVDKFVVYEHIPQENGDLYYGNLLSLEEIDNNPDIYKIIQDDRKK